MRLKWVNFKLKWIVYLSILFMCSIIFFRSRSSNGIQVHKLEHDVETLRIQLKTAKYLLTKPSFEDISFSPVSVKIPVDPFLNVLPHLRSLQTKHPNINLNPTFLAKSDNILRSMGRIVIGIPTIKRLEKDYLNETIRNCLDNIRPEEASLVTFIVLIAERQFVDGLNETVYALRNEFESEIANGILQIIMPPLFWYPPDLDIVEPTFNDSLKRMIWRTKQNLDYAYLMIYAQYFFGSTDYYVQLEDDVISKMGYISAMTVFADKNKNWFTCDFSKLGFIGKLFNTKEMSLLSNFILLFYREKPVDWILDQLFMVRYCHPEEGGCIKKRINGVRRLYHKPALFQHIGRYSSLTGKVQPLKDSSFRRKTQVAAPIQHTNNIIADEISSDFLYFTNDNLLSFYNFSTPLVTIFNQTSREKEDEAASLKGTKLLQIKFFNPQEISGIGLRYFARYQQNVANRIPFDVDICLVDDCSVLNFPQLLFPKIDFVDSKNVTSISVVFENTFDLEAFSLNALIIT